jgi:hypothetical protein
MPSASTRSRRSASLSARRFLLNVLLHSGVSGDAVGGGSAPPTAQSSPRTECARSLARSVRRTNPSAPPRSAAVRRSTSDHSRATIERVGNRGRPGHPEGVRRVFEPLAVQRSEPGRAEALRRLQVTLVSPRDARFGEAFPLREQPLEDLNVRRLRRSPRCSRAACWYTRRAFQRGRGNSSRIVHRNSTRRSGTCRRRNNRKSIGDRLVTR